MVVYGLQRLKLPTINDGVAEISGDVEAIKRELSPHVDTEAFVVVLQTSRKFVVSRHSAARRRVTTVSDPNRSQNVKGKS